MTSSPTPTQGASGAPNRTFASWLRDMPRWKKAVVAAALATVVIGGVMSLTAAPPQGGSGGNMTGLSSSLTGGSTGGGAGSGVAQEEPAAKGVFRLGFSFIAGFCIGSFIRSAIKVAAIAFGFWLVMTMVLQQYGILHVDWQAMGSLWERFAANVEQEWGSFQRFMTGSLPAAGLAVGGLAIGLKRH